MRGLLGSPRRRHLGRPTLNLHSSFISRKPSADRSRSLVIERRDALTAFECHLALRRACPPPYTSSDHRGVHAQRGRVRQGRVKVVRGEPQRAGDRVRTRQEARLLPLVDGAALADDRKAAGW
eukprot:3551265-Prymnesium_polylepis.1